jgi:mannose-1-phosphate guanylyltransferase
MECIKVKDRSGKEQKWVIEKELENAYQVFSNGIITYIYKAGCYSIAGQLFSIETRSNKNNNYSNIPDCLDCSECHKCFIEDTDEETHQIEDRSIDLGYLENDTYGLDIIYDKEGNRYGL